MVNNFYDLFKNTVIKNLKLPLSLETINIEGLLRRRDTHE